MAKKEKVQLENLQGAALLMEELFLSKIYQKHKAYEKNLGHVIETLKQEFQSWEDTRREYTDLGLVVKFQRSNVYSTDWKGLCEYLSDLGLLPLLARIPKELIKENQEVYNKLLPYQNPITQYVKLNPCRFPSELVELDGLNTMKRLGKWKEWKRQLETTETLIEKARQHMLYCPILQKEKNVKCNFGSVSLLNYAPTFDLQAIEDELGSKFLIEYAAVDSEKLQVYIEKGFITPNEVNQFRKVIDIQLKFIIMDAEVERKQREMFQRKNLRAAANRRIG